MVSSDAWLPPAYPAVFFPEPRYSQLHRCARYNPNIKFHIVSGSIQGDVTLDPAESFEPIKKIMIKISLFYLIMIKTSLYYISETKIRRLTNGTL